MIELEHTEEYKIIDFYCGYNGEAEVILYADNEEMHIWDGYFIPIMNCALAKEVSEYKEAFGVVAQYQTCTGWCDVSADKTVVEAPERELAVLKSLDIEGYLNRYRANMEEFCKKEVVEVHEALVNFFREAKGVVYIEEG